LDRFLEHRQGLAGRSIQDVLGRLAVEFGLGWVDLAALAKVTVPAIRKWRLGGQASESSQGRVVEVVALFLTLKDLGIDDPVTWLHTRLVPNGFTVTLLDVYSPKNIGDLLEYARKRTSAVGLLNRAAPGWQDKYRTGFAVVEVEGLGRAIRQRAARG
jgi:hypothetical protein